MTGWRRADRVLVCGGCAVALNVGDPILTIRIDGLKRPLVRGACCAGPAPPDLPALILVAPPLVNRWQSFDPSRVLAFTPPEREPGEDG